MSDRYIHSATFFVHVHADQVMKRHAYLSIIGHICNGTKLAEYWSISVRICEAVCT